MADTSYYEIVMTREQALFACSGYLANRKRLEKKWRVNLIRYNMDTKTGFLWMKRPKFNNVRECIKYLKTSTDGGLFSEYLWEECCLSGRFWKKQVLALKEMLESTEQPEVRLHSDMKFLTNFIKCYHETT